MAGRSSLYAGCAVIGVGPLSLVGRHGLSITPFICQGLSGVLVRLTTCQRLTNSVPKLSLITAVSDIEPVVPVI